MGLYSSKIEDITKTLQDYLHGKEHALRLSLISFFARGHLLIEDLPGLGKTTLAIAIAKSLGLTFGRIQCTSDLLPSDITGLSLYNKTSGEFEFYPGPVFNNLVLCDEINRATPKTQSALLEAMEERQVTIEGKTYRLPQPFCVIATQNPTEQFGTFPLPESQLDRFTMKIGIGYPPKSAEKQILQAGSRRDDIYLLSPVVAQEEVSDIQTDIMKNIHISDRMLEYTLSILEATRKSTYLSAGLSTRGALTITNTAKVNAYFHNRDFVIPEDIRELGEFTIPHRVIFREEYQNLNKREIVKSILDSVPAPL